MEWPIVGRDVVLRRMATHLARGRSQAIFGDEGVGKTRLAAELSRSAAAGGDVVRRVVGSAASVRVPFGALAHLLSMPATSRDELALMTSLMGELRARAAAGRRLVLVADDVHLLDEHSAAFLHQVAAQRVAALLLTARLGEPLPSAMTQVWKDGLAERIEIGPLTRPATAALARSIVGGRIEDLTMSELWRRTRGNPLYLRELVLAGLETGALASDGVAWRARGPLPPSRRLAEVVRDRLGTLTRQQQYALELLAVADSLELDLLSELAGVKAVEALEERRVIQVDRETKPPLVRATHPIYTEVVGANLPFGRQQRIKRELANTLAERGASAPDELFRLALWRLEAGAPPEPELLLAAASRALAVFDAPLGERLARAALDGGGPRRVEVALLLGRALAAQQRVVEAEDVLRAAASHAHSDDEIAGVALALANLLYFRVGQADSATRVLLEALATVRDRDWRNEIESLLALFRSAAGHLRAVAAAGRRMVRMRDARPRAVVHTLLFSSVANIMLGRFSEAEREIRVGLDLSPAAGDELPFAGQMIRINAAMAESYAGRIHRALTLAQAGYHAAVDSGAVELSAMWGLELSEAQMLSGNIEAALETMLSALTIVRESDPFSVAGISAGVSSTLATWLGQHALAAKLQRELADRFVHDVRSRIWSDRATVWRIWADEDARAASVAALEAGRRAASDTHLVWAALIYDDAVRLGAAEHAAERLEGLAARVEGELVPAMARHARALASGDAMALERVASHYERMGAMLLAAEAAANAHRAYLGQGRQRLARVAASRAALLATNCPGVRTPPLIQLSPVPLTARELEIARLAAEGMSSRQLAERLGISVRTVDNHLGTIYAKIGVRGRAELPAVMGSGTPTDLIE